MRLDSLCTRLLNFKLELTLKQLVNLFFFFFFPWSSPCFFWNRSPPGAPRLARTAEAPLTPPTVTCAPNGLAPSPASQLAGAARQRCQSRGEELQPLQDPSVSPRLGSRNQCENPLGCCNVLEWFTSVQMEKLLQLEAARLQVAAQTVLSIVAVAPCWRHASRVPKGASGLWGQCVRTGFPLVVLLLWRCSQVHRRQLELGCSMT